MASTPQSKPDNDNEEKAGKIANYSETELLPQRLEILESVLDFSERRAHDEKEKTMASAMAVPGGAPKVNAKASQEAVPLRHEIVLAENRLLQTGKILQDKNCIVHVNEEARVGKDTTAGVALPDTSEIPTPGLEMTATSTETQTERAQEEAPSPPGEETVSNPTQTPTAVSTPGAFAVAGPGMDDSPLDLALDMEASQTLSVPEQEANNNAADQTPNTNEPVATPIDPNAEDLQTARQLAPKKSPRQEKTSGKWLAMSVATNIVLVVAIIVLVLDPKDAECNCPQGIPNTDGEPTESSTIENMSWQEKRIFALLPEETKQRIQDVGSPQANAKDWIQQDPSLSEYSDQRILARFALATLFYSTNGPEWYRNDNWLSHDHHECDWETLNIDHIHTYFVNPNKTIARGPCDYDDLPFVAPLAHQEEAGGSYQHLWLWNNNIEGTMPEELSLISSLKSIVLGRNKIGGPIPTTLHQLPGLETLFLESNDFTGTIPTEVGMLSSLDRFWVLGSSELSGVIPTEFGQLPNLKELLVDSCNITGSIPTQVGQMTSLEFFWAWSNPLTGILPTELGLLDKMRWLGFWNCQLSGSIPTELGAMKALEELAFDDNVAMSGTIPSELGALTKLTILHMAATGSKGTIPTELGNLELLRSLFLFNLPDLSGTVPSEFGRMTSAWRIWAYNTSLEGEIPTEIGLMEDLVYLQIGSSSLSGEIPTEIGLLTSLKVLDISDSALAGPLPSELGSLLHLESLQLGENSLTGTIPPDMTTFENMTTFALHDNFLAGPVPEELGLMTALSILSISNNSLTGTVPSALCNLTSWQEEGSKGILVDCDLVECTCGVCFCDR